MSDNPTARPIDFNARIGLYHLAIPYPTRAALAELQADGPLTGYGDAAKSSSELARELREQFSQREHVVH